MNREIASVWIRAYVDEFIEIIDNHCVIPCTVYGRIELLEQIFIRYMQNFFVFQYSLFKLSIAKKKLLWEYTHQHLMLYIYRSTIYSPLIEYCSHICSGVPGTCLQILDKIQRRNTNGINPNLAPHLQSFYHWRVIVSLCLFY